MWRANACPLWLFAPLASRLVWNGMGQALAFLRLLVLGLGDTLAFCSQMLSQDASGVGKFLAWMEVWRLKGTLCLGGRSSSPVSHLAACPGCQAWSWCCDASTLVFPLFGNSPAAMLLDLPQVHLCPVSQGTLGIQAPTGAFGTWGQQEPAGTWVPWVGGGPCGKMGRCWKVDESRHGLLATPVPAPR